MSALRAVDQRGQQVRRDDVDGHHVRSVVDAGVVDDGVHVAEPLTSSRDGARLLEVGEVADDDGGTAVDEVVDRGEPVRVADVDDDLVAVVEQRLARPGGRGRPRSR